MYAVARMQRPPRPPWPVGCGVLPRNDDAGGAPIEVLWARQYVRQLPPPQGWRRRVRPFQVRLEEVRPFQMRAGEARPLKSGAGEVRPFHVRAAELRPLKAGAAEVRPFYSDRFAPVIGQLREAPAAVAGSSDVMEPPTAGVAWRPSTPRSMPPGDSLPGPQKRHRTRTWSTTTLATSLPRFLDSVMLGTSLSHLHR
jgi:hypothetical protein